MEAPGSLATGPALWSFLAYLTLVVAIGVWASRFSSRGMSAYFLAGRGLNRWVVALSAVVSGRSSWLLLGLTGMAYVQGLSALWAAVGYVAVEFLLFWDYAGRLRRFSEARDCITLPDFFAARFADRGALRALIVLVFLVFLPTYVGAQFAGGGKAFAAAFGMSQTTGLWLTAAIVLVYTVLGGFLAVSLTDMLQALFMVLALVVLPIVAITSAGGWGEVTATLDPSMLDPMAIGAGALIGFVGIGLGSPGNPHILVRYMSIDDPAQLRASAVVATVWNAVMATGAVLTGVVGRALIPAVESLPGADKENLYTTLAANQLHPILYGVVLASVFAAIMSTTDSQLLVAASSVVRDVYEKLLRAGEPVDQKKLVRLSRVVVVVLVVLSALLGMVGGSVVFWFVLLAWAGLGAALGPTSILALYWSRTTRAGVIAGILAGGVTAAVWRVWRAELGGLYELIPAFAAGTLATVVVSLMTRPPEDADAMLREMKD
jgi:sodium/proline symporter